MADHLIWVNLLSALLVLILVIVDYGGSHCHYQRRVCADVLILVIVDYGGSIKEEIVIKEEVRFNPCYSGL